MNNEIEELKLEIQVLKKRIEILEGIENRRKIFKIIKFLIYIIVIILVILFAYNFYNKIIDMLNNPLKGLL